MDREPAFAERMIFWMPLAPSEDLALHERDVRHQAEEMADPPEHLRAEYAFGIGQATVAHGVVAHGVIARFGRYPHRNEMPGRYSTPEELKYLRTDTSVHLRRPLS
jgi:uncharacterized protein (DUF924 family)